MFQRLLQHRLLDFLDRQAIGQQGGTLCSPVSRHAGRALWASFEVSWQIVHIHVVPLARDGHPLDHVLEFADVPGPRIGLDDLHGRRRKPRDPRAPLPPVLREKMLQQNRNIAPPLAQRRQVELTDADAVEKVLTKLPLLDQVPELLVGGHQEPEIDLDAFDAPQRLDHVVFQHAQELGLNRVAHLVDFVKKERAAMRQEQAARLGFPGVRERSLLVTEQLGLQQQFGERRAVDRDHGSPGPRAGIVDRPGQELLAGPALAADQHRRVGHGEVLGERLHLGELDGPADDVVEIEPGAQFLAQPPVLLGQPAHLQRAPDHDL